MHAFPNEYARLHIYIHTHIYLVGNLVIYIFFLISFIFLKKTPKEVEMFAPSFAMASVFCFPIYLGLLYEDDSNRKLLISN